MKNLDPQSDWSTFRAFVVFVLATALVFGLLALWNSEAGATMLYQQDSIDSCTSNEVNDACFTTHSNYNSYQSFVFPTGGYVNTARMKLRKDADHAYKDATCVTKLGLRDSNGSWHFSTTGFTNQGITSSNDSYTDVLFTWSGADLVNLSNTSITAFGFPTGWSNCDNENGIVMHAENSSGDWYAILETSNDASVNYVDWNSPQFFNGMQTADFQNWWVVANIVNGASSSSGSNGYYVVVHSGTSTSSMNTLDSTMDTVGKIPIYSLPLNDSVMIAKSATTAPDTTLYAYATLHRLNSSGSTEQIATSSVISIKITAGELVLEPGTPNYPKEYTGTDKYRKIFQKKFPFEYVYQMVDLVDVLSSTTTSATFTELSLTFPAIQQLNNATTSIPFFSKTEMLKILPMGTWDFVRTIEGAFVILMTGFYFLNRIKSFQHGGDENA